MTTLVQAFFLPGPVPAKGERMALLRLPQGAVRGVVSTSMLSPRR